MQLKIIVNYFPAAMRYIAAASILAVIYLIYEGHYKSAFVLFAVSLFIWTARYVTVISLEPKAFLDAFSFYGIMIVNERRTFHNIEAIIATKGNYSNKINTRASSRQLDWSDYTGTLIYDGNGELELLTHRDKKILMQTLKTYASMLKCEVIDNSIVAKRKN